MYVKWLTIIYTLISINQARSGILDTGRPHIINIASIIKISIFHSSVMQCFSDPSINYLKFFGCKVKDLNNLFAICLALIFVDKDVA